MRYLTAEIAESKTRQELARMYNELLHSYRLLFNNLETKTIGEGFKKFSWNSLSGCKIVPIPNYLKGQENELILHVPKNIYEKLVEEQALRQQESRGGDDE
jgi:hypothetical protein